MRIKLEWLGQAGCHIMGRTTYVEMAAHWPHSEDAYAAPRGDVASASARRASVPSRACGMLGSEHFQRTTTEDQWAST
jgi:dihydrofolate reductase